MTANEFKLMNNMFSLKNKTVVITGGESGIEKRIYTPFVDGFINKNYSGKEREMLDLIVNSTNLFNKTLPVFKWSFINNFFELPVEVRYAFIPAFKTNLNNTHIAFLQQFAGVANT